MKTRTSICIAVAGGLLAGLPSRALAQTTPNNPINNYSSVLGDLSAFFTTGDPNVPIGGLLDQHARWHHQGIRGGRTIPAGQPGSGTEFLTFHREFVRKVYDAENGAPLADDFNRVTPWMQVPDAERALSDYPAAAESRLQNAAPDFATEDELGIYIEQNLHNWIHGATATVFGDNVIGDPHHSPQSTYFYHIHGFVNYLWQMYFPQNCQAASDFYGIVAGVTFGFAPARVQQWWRDNSCNTNPASTNSCQKVSNLYNTQASISWGAAPNDVQNWWISNGCNTQPTISMDTCSSISNTYATWASVAWGSSPSEVHDVWIGNGCAALPDQCQRASDLYGIVAGQTWGSAPTDVQYFWRANNCNASPRWQ